MSLSLFFILKCFIWGCSIQVGEVSPFPICLFPAQVDPGTDSGFRKLSANDIGYPPPVTSIRHDTALYVSNGNTKALYYAIMILCPVVGRQC